MAEPRDRPRWSRVDAERARHALAGFGLGPRARHSLEARALLAELVAASAADSLPPLDSPRAAARGLMRVVKARLRSLLWSRMGAPREQQAQFNLELIRLGSELLAEPGGRANQ